ncbi:unnamed protein product [Effrenium voratum]|nr:unnamed protein product [Effrenium voratum]
MQFLSALRGKSAGPKPKMQSARAEKRDDREAAGQQQQIQRLEVEVAQASEALAAARSGAQEARARDQRWQQELARAKEDEARALQSELAAQAREAAKEEQLQATAAAARGRRDELAQRAARLQEEVRQLPDLRTSEQRAAELRLEKSQLEERAQEKQREEALLAAACRQLWEDEAIRAEELRSSELGAEASSGSSSDQSEAPEGAIDYDRLREVWHLEAEVRSAKEEVQRLRDEARQPAPRQARKPSLPRASDASLHPAEVLDSPPSPRQLTLQLALAEPRGSIAASSGSVRPSSERRSVLTEPPPAGLFAGSSQLDAVLQESKTRLRTTLQQQWHSSQEMLQSLRWGIAEAEEQLRAEQQKRRICEQRLRSLGRRFSP